MLEKLALQKKSLLLDFAPVIEAYENVATNEAADRVEEYEETRDKHQGMYINVRRKVEKLSTPVPESGTSSTGELAAALQAVAAAQPANAAPPVSKPRTRLPELPPIMFGGSRVVYPQFKQLFEWEPNRHR